MTETGVHLVSNEPASDLRLRPDTGARGDQPFSKTWERRLGEPVARLSASDDGSLVAAVCAAGRLVILSAAGEIVGANVSRETLLVAIAGNASRIAAVTSAGVLSVIAPDGAPIWRRAMDEPIGAIALSPDGHVLAAALHDGRIWVFEAGEEGYRLVETARRAPGGVTQLRVRADGEVIAGWAADATRAPSHQEASRSATVADTVTALSPDGAWEVRVDTRRVAIMRRPGEDRPTREFEHGLADASTHVSVSNAGTLGIVSKRGTVSVFTRRGHRLWTFPSDEVCDFCWSADASSFVVGGDDGSVRAFTNAADDRVVDRIAAACDRVRDETDPAARLLRARELTALLSALSPAEHAADLLKECGAYLGERAASELATALFEERLLRRPNSAVAHFCMGEIMERTQALKAAAHFIKAGQEPSLRPKALSRASVVLQKAGLPAAAGYASRQAGYADETSRMRRILYRIGREYEAAGKHSEAKRYYELVFAIAPDYHDVANRLLLDPDDILAGGDDEASAPLPGERAADDAGLRRAPVNGARAKDPQGLWESEAGRRFDRLITDLFGPAQQPTPELRICYDVASYMRYDVSTAEDEIKKSIELLHTLEVTEQNGPLHDSLDIGTATGRYPLVLAERGIRAIGIDVEPVAVDYARRKSAGESNPQFQVGDGRQLRFDDSSFDLVTCMMGTPAHFTPDVLAAVLKEAHRCLRVNGILIFSTWDVECPHLTFLSIYSEAHKELLRQNSLTRGEFVQAVEQAMFRIEDVRPVGLLPDTLHYHLDLHQHGARRIRELLEMEHSVHAIAPDAHGQMFFCFARKTP